MNTPAPSSDSVSHARAGSSLWNRGDLTFAQVLRRIWSRFQQDRMLDQSAKLAFYCVLSAFPFLFFLMTVFGLVMHAQPDFQATLQEYLMAVIPGSASGVVGNALDEIASSAGGGQVSLALIFTLWTASRCVVALTEALNIAYDVEDARPWWKKNAVALGLTLFLLLLTTAALFTMIYGGHYSVAAAGKVGAGTLAASVWGVLRWVLPILFALLAFNVLYVFAPKLKNRRWHWLMPGTVVGVGLWLVGSYGFKWYLSYFDSYTVTYGSIGAILILVLWFFLSAIAFLAGGEVNSVLKKVSDSSDENASRGSKGGHNTGQ